MADESGWEKQSGGVDDQGRSRDMWVRIYPRIAEDGPAPIVRTGLVTQWPALVEWRLVVNGCVVRNDSAKSVVDACLRCDSFAGRIVEIWND